MSDETNYKTCKTVGKTFICSQLASHAAALKTLPDMAWPGGQIFSG